MPRVKRGSSARARRKKVLKRAKGYWGARGRLFRPANETVMRALNNAWRDRRRRKRDFRRLWITRINAAARQHGLSYSRLTNGLRTAGVELNRKMLAELAVHDPDAFRAVAEKARASL